MSLAQLKKKSRGVSALQQRLEEMKGNAAKAKTTDYWKLSVDDSGVGSAVIRLLPEHVEEDFPFVKISEYGFGVYSEKEKKKLWYFNRSLENIGKKDPVKEEFWALMTSGDKELKDQGKLIRDRDSYIVWIYVVNDTNVPANNGKVMKAKLSPSIWKYVEDKLTPKFPEDPVVDVFDLNEGANLHLRAYNGENDMRTYDRTFWANPAPLFDSEEELENVYKQVQGLKSELDPANPLYKKTYEELEARLEVVLGRPLYKNVGKVDSKQELNDAFEEPEKSNYNETSLDQSVSKDDKSTAELDLEALLNED